MDKKNTKLEGKRNYLLQIFIFSIVLYFLYITRNEATSWELNLILYILIILCFIEIALGIIIIALESYDAKRLVLVS